MRLNTVVRIIILIVITCPFASIAQVINIESKRIVTDTTGWAGDVALTYNLNKNQTTQFAIASGAHVQFKTKKDLFLLFGNYSLLQADNERFVNQGLGHFRYNRKVNKWLRWEAFTQLQYNRILRIESRLLMGTGPRYKVKGGDKFRLYAGNIYMYEVERVVEGEDNYDHRLSSYLSFSFEPNDRIEMSTTYYYQPRLTKWNDFRIAGQVDIQIEITKQLDFITRYNYFYDRLPPAEVEREVYSISNGISFEF